MILIIMTILVCITIITGVAVYSGLPSYFTWNPADEFQIEDLLASYEKLEEFKSGILTCTTCGEAVSHINMGPIVETEDEVQLDILCNNSECIIGYFDSQESLSDDITL